MNAINSEGASTPKAMGLRDFVKDNSRLVSEIGEMFGMNRDMVSENSGSSPIYGMMSEVENSNTVLSSVLCHLKESL